MFQGKRLFTALVFGSATLLYGCGSSLDDSATTAEGGAADTAGPVVSDLSLVQNPNPTVPLAAVLSFTTDEPASVVLRFDDGSKAWSHSMGSDMSTSHELPVVGMRPSLAHTITASLTDAAGNVTVTETQVFETPALPEFYPRPHVVVSQPDRMEPGVNLFNVNGRWPEKWADSLPAVIVDNEGETIWYYQPEGHLLHDIKRISNGNFLYEIWPGTGGMVEIDLLGNIVNRWHFTGTAKDPAPGSIAVESDSIHHDMIEIPNGNFLVMSSEVRAYDNWHTSTRDANAPRQDGAQLVGDVIIEITRDGEVVNEWKLLDLIDPYRITHGSLREDYWANHYDGRYEGIVYDYTHGNAIIYDESDNSFIMSMPYQNAVLKVSMSSGELVWILGTHEAWSEEYADKLLTPVGDVEWSYKHHAISHSGRGTLLLLDNGVDRTMPYADSMPLADSYSRGVEYAVNEETMEVSQPWAYGLEQEHYYNRYLGDIDWLPTTGNILINSGARETAPGTNTNVPPGQAQRWASWFEVTSDDAREKVWELQFKDEGLGWSVYRVDRLPSIYPN
ncbi:MAG: aryl-sulfate sulfotransferase [Arenicellaceae bacterium]|nr:aryl-sulfate sulfotransferase [Arenicellaceae bacterium]